jgi:hypothetical protein
MRAIASGLLALSLLFVVADRGYAGCGDNPGDDAAVAAARAQVATDCSCAGSPTHGAYVACAATVARDRAQSDPPLLPKNCRGAVVKCAAKSTCGKPGFVTCCRTSSKGTTKCSTKSDAALCKVPKNGSACVSSLSSCCDACTETGCASPSGAFLDGPAATHF